MAEYKLGMSQRRVPDASVTVTDDDRKGVGGEKEIDCGEIVVGEGLYAYDASTQPNRSQSTVLFSTDPFAINVEGGEYLYVADDGNELIRQWECSSPYDMSTASLLGNLNVNPQDYSPNGLALNNDGSKLYMVGNGTDTIYEYDLPTAYDVRTASLSASLDISTEDSIPQGMTFNNDGSKLYMAGQSTDTIYEYDVSATFDVTTASQSATLNVTAGDGNPYDVAWNNDGTKLYVVQALEDNLREYDCSTAFDISTASLRATFDTSPEDSDPEDIAWGPYGGRLYVIGDSNDKLYEYDLSTAFDLKTASFISSFDMEGLVPYPTGVLWSG